MGKKSNILTHLWCNFKLLIKTCRNPSCLSVLKWDVPLVTNIKDSHFYLLGRWTCVNDTDTCITLPVSLCGDSHPCALNPLTLLAQKIFDPWSWKPFCKWGPLSEASRSKRKAEEAGQERAMTKALGMEPQTGQSGFLMPVFLVP